MEKDQEERFERRINQLLTFEKSAREALISLLVFTGVVVGSLVTYEICDDAIDRNPTEAEWNDPQFRACFENEVTANLTNDYGRNLLGLRSAEMHAEDTCLERISPQSK